MYTCKLTAILFILLIACSPGFSQNIQNEEEELLRSLNGSYSANELYPELEVFYSQLQTTKATARSNVRIIQSGKGNNSHILTQGNNNSSDIIQFGENNLYKLDLDGDRITSKAKQIGKNNYLEDIIIGSDIYRETIQIGYGNTIYNQGINNLPMIIQQKGVNKTIKISGTP